MAKKKILKIHNLVCEPELFNSYSQKVLRREFSEVHIGTNRIIGTREDILDTDVSFLEAFKEACEEAVVLVKFLDGSKEPTVNIKLWNEGGALTQQQSEFFQQWGGENFRIFSMGDCKDIISSTET